METEVDIMLITIKDKIITDVKNPTLTLKLNELDRFTAILPKDCIDLIENEVPVLTEHGRFLIKDYDKDYGHSTIIKAVMDVDDLYIYKDAVSYINQTCETILNGLLEDSGWTLSIKAGLNDRRNLTGDNENVFNLIIETIKKFGYEAKFDNVNKIIYVDRELGTDKGVYFSKDLNLREISCQAESYDFYTRIIPEGKNGLRIAQINDGKDFLENLTYSKSIKTYYWKDERYTNIENLKRDGQKKLDVMSNPKKTWSLNVADLSGLSNYKILSFEIGDTVTIVERDIYLKHRIIEVEKDLDNPINNKIKLSSVQQRLSNRTDQIEEKVNSNWEITNVKIENTENSILESVETAKNYTDESFRTYKTEREQTDQSIRETITEATTYVDPQTGQTKPITNKMVEQVQSLDGFKHSVEQNYTDKVTLNNLLAEIQDQIDGAIDTWFYDPEPSLTNEPAVNWTTDEQKNSALGDLYFSGSGKSYRWSKKDGEYQWIQITDSGIAEAIEEARAAMQLAGSKMRVYVSEKYLQCTIDTYQNLLQLNRIDPDVKYAISEDIEYMTVLEYTTSPPQPPYSLGDTWYNADGEVLICVYKRDEGIHQASDWQLATNYATKSELRTEIEQTTEKISLLASRTNQTEADIASIVITANQIESRVSSNETDISTLIQTAEQINLEVKGKVGKDNVISSINASKEGIKIAGKNITIDGNTTFSSNVKINGVLTAITGKIGGWKITSDSLEAGTGNAYVRISAGSTWAFAAGNQAEPWNAPFRVNNSGFVYCSNIYVTGNSTIQGSVITGKIASADNITWINLGTGDASFYNGTVTIGPAADGRRKILKVVGGVDVYTSSGTKVATMHSGGIQTGSWKFQANGTYLYLYYVSGGTNYQVGRWHFQNSANERSYNQTGRIRATWYSEAEQYYKRATGTYL